MLGLIKPASATTTQENKQNKFQRKKQVEPEAKANSTKPSIELVRLINKHSSTT
jgi:hypothetical protein